jgi:hypothetical protein
MLDWFTVKKMTPSRSALLFDPTKTFHVGPNLNPNISWSFFDAKYCTEVLTKDQIDKDQTLAELIENLQDQGYLNIREMRNWTTTVGYEGQAIFVDKKSVVHVCKDISPKPIAQPKYQGFGFRRHVAHTFRKSFEYRMIILKDLHAMGGIRNPDAQSLYKKWTSEGDKDFQQWFSAEEHNMSQNVQDAVKCLHFRNLIRISQFKEASKMIDDIASAKVTADFLRRDFLSQRYDNWNLKIKQEANTKYQDKLVENDSVGGFLTDKQLTELSDEFTISRFGQELQKVHTSALWEDWKQYEGKDFQSWFLAKEHNMSKDTKDAVKDLHFQNLIQNRQFKEASKMIDDIAVEKKEANSSDSTRIEFLSKRYNSWMLQISKEANKAVWAEEHNMSKDTKDAVKDLHFQNLIQNRQFKEASKMIDDIAFEKTKANLSDSTRSEFLTKRYDDWMFQIKQEANKEYQNKLVEKGSVGGVLQWTEIYDEFTDSRFGQELQEIHTKAREEYYKKFEQWLGNNGSKFENFEYSTNDAFGHSEDSREKRLDTTA